MFVTALSIILMILPHYTSKIFSHLFTSYYFLLSKMFASLQNFMTLNMCITVTQ